MGRVKQKRVYHDGSYKFVLMKVINNRRPYVRMVADGHEYHKSIAKLVLSSFQYREGCDCANITYLDGNMKNCQLSNLRYKADKSVFVKIQTEEKQNETKPKPKPKPAYTKTIIRSCQSCRKCPCFSGMENLSTDFGAAGCRKYKPKSNKLI